MPIGNTHVFQIIGDEYSRLQLNSLAIPLDNSKNPYPTWQEYSLIKNYFTQASLNSNDWYGFFSVDFSAKTGIPFHYIFEMVRAYGEQADVLLFPQSWDELAYFRNIFEHGDVKFPGLLKLAQGFLEDHGIVLDLKELVTHAGNSILGNNVIAKLGYWREWLELADRFFDYVENPKVRNATEISLANNVLGNRLSAKLLIQERLSAIVMRDQNLKIAALDFSLHTELSACFDRTEKTRRTLQVCDLLKRLHVNGDPMALPIFYVLKEIVPMSLAALSSPSGTLTK